jgi:glucuronokinase
MAPRSDRRHATRTVPARAGIVGNPSDGYGGRVVATTIGQLCAQVTASVAERPADEPGDGAALLAAARGVAEEWLTADAAVEVIPTTLTFTTDIPRQVGLAGSSAIAIGVIEALAELHGVEPEPTTVARLALRTEVDVLGIAAGPQDRVVQAHRGVLDMQFGEMQFRDTDVAEAGPARSHTRSPESGSDPMRFAGAWDPARYRRLPEAALGDLVVAWHPDPGDPSGVVHGDLRARWDAGDPDVHEVMASLADLAGRAADVLRSGSRDALAPIIDEACRLRRRLWTFSAVDEQLLAVAERADAAATLAGSGGAIVAVARGGTGGAGDLCAAFTEVGLCALVPQTQTQHETQHQTQAQAQAQHRADPGPDCGPERSPRPHTGDAAVARAEATSPGGEQ